jgi:hypothetical protein
MSLTLLFFFSFLTGVGSCAAFQAALKTAALNWPTHRGTATAFPLAAFGLSAFFFASLSNIVFPENTSDFLLLLSFGTFGLAFTSLFFLRIAPVTTSYTAVPTNERTVPVGRHSNQLHHTKNISSRLLDPGSAEPRKKILSLAHTQRSYIRLADLSRDGDHPIESISTSELGPGDHVLSASGPEDNDDHQLREIPSIENLHRPDITGFKLLKQAEFWRLWSLMGLLTGIGLMTIK